MKPDPKLEKELQQLETTANNFAFRCIRMIEVRSTYLAQIMEMSASIRAAVNEGQLSKKPE